MLVEVRGQLPVPFLRHQFPFLQHGVYKLTPPCLHAFSHGFWSGTRVLPFAALLTGKRPLLQYFYLTQSDRFQKIISHWL